MGHSALDVSLTVRRQKRSMTEDQSNDESNKQIPSSTLKDMIPGMQEIKQYNEHLNPPTDETNTLTEETVCFCLPLFTFGNKKNDSFAGDAKQALVATDMKETIYKVREILELLSKENFEQKLGGGVGRGIIHGPFGVPAKPEFTVGLDTPLSKLKMEVLREGASIVALSGLAGIGKTTLATELCWDEQVKVPDFQSEEEAVKRLGLLLRKIEGSSMLLVLDNVWPVSEALVKKFQVLMPDSKIIVTTRGEFPRLGTQCVLKPLVHDDAITLFRHYALLKESCSSIPEEVIQKVLKSCNGLPLFIKVIGSSLCNQPPEYWPNTVEELSQCLLDSNIELLDNSVLKECFRDLGLFPEDQRIPFTSLIDMWAELYGLDDDGIEAMSIINKLDSMNLANVLVERKMASNTDNYFYNNHFIVVHDILRELAIYQSTQEPIERRKRLIIKINKNKPECWLGEKSKLLGWRVKQKPQHATAHTLSISTDENCTSDCPLMMQLAQVEVLIFNLQTRKYSFPDFIEEMNKLKVLIVTNYSFHPSEMSNFDLFGSISNLKRIRLERIFVPSFVALKNLKKLSLYMCNMKQAFENNHMLISYAFPNLEELNIDYCKDMVASPKGLCDISSLKKLRFTNCDKISALPQEIGKLLNLELLSLSCCTDLEGIPASIGRLSNLRVLDISNCISLPSLPEDFSNLSNLQNLYMRSCARCKLPFSVSNLKNLKVVVCDEVTATSWDYFKPMLPNLKIDTC